jgi:hypothetical protein
MATEEGSLRRGVRRFLESQRVVRKEMKNK